MAMEQAIARATDQATAPSLSISLTPSGREALKLFERELVTYLRELPRLLQEGHAWRHVLVKGDEILGIWNAQSEAIQAGSERFGLEPVFVKTIDPRDPQRFALLEAWKASQCPS